MEKHKPKIAVIGLKGLPAFGGAATVGENIILQLQSDYDFTVYATSSHTSQKTGNYLGYKQIVFRKLPFKRINTLYYYIISALHALFFCKYDLVHLHHRDAAFIIPLLKLKYKVILTTHGIFKINDKWKKYHIYFKIQEKYFVKKANIITCVSKNEQRKFKAILNLDVNFIPNGIHELNESNLRTSSHNNTTIVFAAGRIIPGKGCDIMLRSLNLMNYNGNVHIIGDLNQVFEYKEQVIELSKSLDVKFIDLIKDKNLLLEQIREGDVFIFPSNKEAFSIMLLEAASVKIPIIASDITENKDIFDDREILFFKTDDVKDLADKITWALQNKAEMAEKANNSYTKLVKEYTWKDIALKYHSLYEQLLLKK